tara:strand:- start:148 stop:1485 length:1338 start_codon:yes stop_codon:yes gene_type:complete
MLKQLLPGTSGSVLKTIYVLLAVLSTYSTFGARIYQGDDVPTALLYALGTSAFNAFVWFSAFPVFPHLRDNKVALGLATVVLFGCCVFTASMSGLQNMIDFAADQAFRIEAKSGTAELAEARDKSLRNRIALQDLLPVLEHQSVLYKGRRISEYRDGAYTGTAGPGDVEKALGKISGEFAALAIRVKADLKQTRKLNDEIKRILARMRAAARADTDHEKRMAKLMRASDEFALVFNRMNGKGSVFAIKFSLDNMAGELALIRKPSRKPHVAERQKAAIARLRAEINASGKALEPYLLPILNAEKIEAPKLEPLNAQDVVLKHWDSFIPQWLVAFGIDLWPVLGLTMGMVLIIIKDPRERAGENIGDMPHRVVMNVLEYGDEIKEAKFNRQQVLPLRDAARGYSDDDDVPERSLRLHGGREENSGKDARKSKTKIFGRDDLDESEQ